MGKTTVVHIRDSRGIYGAERVILSLGTNIDGDEYDFILLCMIHADGAGRDLVDNAKRLGIKVIPVDVKKKIDMVALGKIRSIFKTNNVSILHSHDYKANLYSLLASINLGIKRVLTNHGSTRDSFRKKLYLFISENVICRFYDKNIAVSKEIMEQILKRGVKPERVELIQNGIDPALLDWGVLRKNNKFLPPKYLDEKVYAVIGRLFPDKGHRLFLRAFVEVLKEFPNIKALIVGDGPAKKEIVEEIRKLALEEKVILCGARSDMENVYKQIDFLVIPSLREGLPYVLLEAMMFKIPVIASAVGEIPLIIKNEETGYLFSPGKIELMRKGMIDALKYPEKAKAMSERAYGLVVDRFSAEQMTRNTERLYRGLIEETGDIKKGMT